LSVSGAGNYPFLSARGWGIELQVRKSLGSAWGGMLTARIVPRIKSEQVVNYGHPTGPFGRKFVRKA